MLGSQARHALNNAQGHLASFRSSLTLPEISGAFGDIGTFLPLLVALVRTVGLDLGTTLCFTGLYNIFSGLFFGIPMPVQPMKAIAAVAISNEDITLTHVLAGGIFVSAVTFLLGITRLINVFNRIVPSAVVRGLQLSLGLSLATTGVKNVWFKGAEEHDLKEKLGAALLGQGRDVTVYLGLAATAFLLVMLHPSNEEDVPKEPSAGARPASQGALQEAVTKASVQRQRQSPVSPLHQHLAEGSAGDTGGAMATNRASSASLNLWLGPEQPRVSSQNPITEVARRMPGALLVVLAGLIVAVIQYPSVLRTLRFGPSMPQIVWPTWEEWKKGVILTGIPQLPVTTLNSVVAVCQLSADLFPARPAQPVLVSVSVGLMNMVGAWFGAMPCCHGAGGLAAQVKFGARTGAAPVALGCVKLALGLLLGSSLAELLRAFPQPLLGSLLIFSGIELASSCTRVVGDREKALLFITAGASSALGNSAFGALAGIVAGALLALWDLAAARCAGAGSWSMRAVSGSLSSSSIHSGPDGGSQHYYQAVTDDLPSEYWGPPRQQHATLPPPMPSGPQSSRQSGYSSPKFPHGFA
ncbi:hypothetical protein CVIRNUC_008404 [Coccomyxa viridis]|uniref:Molybdate transporter 1 n=1 Tax=Coccomyxa viridis TaxID=1274662 RepID=A0AAV1ID71_9CHLO|nr:hypothetical protein CVIRNUC_008404 [Coccomyxa viridis]